MGGKQSGGARGRGWLVALGLFILLVGLAGVLRDRGSALGSPVTGDIALRDPFVVAADGGYYLYSTGSGLPVRRSADGQDWDEIGAVFPDGLPSWTADIASDAAPWAPSLANFQDRWHLYYAVSTFGTWTSAIGLATSPTLDPDDPAYGWTDQGIVLNSEHNDTLAKLGRGENAWNAIDPWVVLDGDDPWLAWGSFAGGIYLQQIEPATGLLDGGTAVHHLAKRPSGQDGIEAANLVERDGMWYLFTSWDYCCRGVESTYSIRVGRAEDITGPYVDQRGQPLLEGGGSLALGPYGHVVGPGHSAVLREGDSWALAHHYYDARSNGQATLSIRPLLWTSEGWPAAAETGFVPAGSSVSAEQMVGSWVVAGYGREHPELAHGEVRFDLNGDGTVGSNAGSWTLGDGGVVTMTVRPDCGAERSYELLVDENAAQMHGRTTAGAAVRSLRTQPGDPSPAC